MKSKFLQLDQRPLIIAMAGSNGAGKTTFYFTYLQQSGLPLVNADVIAKEVGAAPYLAAQMAAEIREKLLHNRHSFVFETVFSDPVGDKIDFLRRAEDSGYTVTLCFIGITGPHVSQQRVNMRVLQGGHDVPKEKIEDRFPRTLQNLQESIRVLSHVIIFDNSDLSDPYRLVAVFEKGQSVFLSKDLPEWLKKILKD